MVSAERAHSPHDATAFSGAVSDGRGTVAVRVGRWEERQTWPQEVLLLGDDGAVERVHLGTELRDLAWDEDGRLWASTSLGLGIWAGGDRL